MTAPTPVHGQVAPVAGAYDGRRPDWGAHAIDWSVLPAAFVDVFRTGTRMQLQWLNTLVARTGTFMAKVPAK